MNSTKKLWGVVVSSPLATLLAMLATVGVVSFELTIPLLTKDAVDVALGEATGAWATRLLPQFSPLLTIIIVLVAVALGRFISQFGRRYTAGLLSINVQHRLRIAILDALQKLDGPGQDRIRVGQVVSRSISDITMIQGLVAMFPLGVGHVLKLIFTVVVMLVLSPLLALVAIASLPLIFFGALASRKPMFAATWAAQQSAADLATHVEETVTGIRVVKAFAQEQREIDAIEKAGRKVYADRMRSARLTARFQPMVDQLPQLALVTNIALGGWLALSGAITIGTFVAFAAYLSSLTAVSRMLSGLALRINMSRSSVSRVFDVLELKPEHQDPTTPTPIPDGPLGLALNDVTFRDGDRRILDKLSFTVSPGETLTLVGPPGAGKTMAVQLMGAFYQPDSGSLSLLSSNNAIDFAKLHRAELRRSICVVFDEPFLYSDTIRMNLTMGEAYTQEEIEHAARATQAHEFITELADGYDQVVGERGLTLSGGQRQRIALARALLARPRILILDDATSAIDATTEARIYAALRRDFHDVTIIAVAHRQSTLDLADRITLIERGQVTAIGPLSTMRGNARFARLMDLNFREDTGEHLPFDEQGCAEPEWDKLWPCQEPNPQGITAVTTQEAAGMVAGPMGRGGGRGGMGMAAAIPATPELLEQVAKLPPASESPRLDTRQARTTREPFRLMPLFRQVRWLIVAVIGCLLIGVATDLAFPTLVRFAIDHGVIAQDASALWLIAGVGAVIVLISWITAMVQTVLTARTGERLLFGLRLRTYAHLMRLSLDYFERTMSGRIMTRMTTDIDALSSFLQTGVAQAIVSLATLLGISGMLLATDTRLALVALASLPILIVATHFFRRISARLYAQAREQISTVNAMFHENISGLRISQMHGMEAHSLREFEDAADTYRRTRIASQTAVALYFPGIGALNELAAAAVLGFGTHHVLQGDISAGVLVAFVMYMGLLFWPVQQLSQLFDGYQQAAVGLTRISELLATTPTVADNGTAPGADTAARGTLAMADVSFGYGPDLPVVTEHLSLSIEPGSTVALVGATGSGKSTLVKLLARFYDPVAGTVTASGTDIQHFPLHDWRRTIGLVPQESHLFSGTVADNIAYGRPTANEAEITAAARRVGALTAIAAIPGGFNHPVGERGRGLSSGQRQLIALARAEMCQPAIMLLDEATATLDPATEATILNASDRVTSTRTSIIVAHRLATAARADRILVVSAGRIIEDGTHDELLATKGAYATMWHAQP